MNGEWRAFVSSTDPDVNWVTPLPVGPTGRPVVDERRFLAHARIEAGQCPACGAPVTVVGGWARCPNRGRARPGGQGPVEFQLRTLPESGISVFYRETGEIEEADR